MVIVSMLPWKQYFNSMGTVSLFPWKSHAFTSMDIVCIFTSVFIHMYSDTCNVAGIVSMVTVSSLPVSTRNPLVTRGGVISFEIESSFPYSLTSNVIISVGIVAFCFPCKFIFMTKRKLFPWKLHHIWFCI